MSLLDHPLDRNGNQPTPAAQLPVQDIRKEHIGSKVRVAGYATTYSHATQLGLLSHSGATILLDYRSIAASSQFEPPEDKTKIMVMGDLYAYKTELPEEYQASLPFGLSPPLAGVVLIVLRWRECQDLDMEVWTRAARQESLSRWTEAEQNQRRWKGNPV